MPRGIGRAMERALAGKDDGAPPEARESLLMNPQRRELFHLLCLRPYSTAGELARRMKLSSNAVRWHLDRMAAENLVMREPDATYYPRDLLDPEDAPLFKVLAERVARRVFRAVLESPGATQRELCAAVGASRQAVFKSANLLERHGLLSSLEDGRFRRYYPTGLLFERRDAHRPRAKAFADGLIKRLERGGLSPQVIRRTDRQILLRIARGRSADVIDLTLDPFTTTLE